jgi:hypothetical protein
VEAITNLSAAPAGDLARALPLRAAPNPFRAETALRFAAPGDGTARVEFFDVTGRLVRALASPAGGGPQRTIAWDGRDEAGQELACGVYLARAQCGDAVSTGRIVKLR